MKFSESLVRDGFGQLVARSNGSPWPVNCDTPRIRWPPCVIRAPENKKTSPECRFRGEGTQRALMRSDTALRY